MLDSRDVDFEYREYTEDPLTQAEIRKVLALLGLGPRDVLRRNDKSYRELGLNGSESDARLVELMSTHPTVLQRPIGLLDDKAVVGRPPEALLALLE